MELLGTSTIIGYILSTFSMKYVLVDDEDKSQKKIVFDLIYFISLVLFTIYTYLLMQDFYQKFNFIVSSTIFNFLASSKSSLIIIGLNAYFVEFGSL